MSNIKKFPFCKHTKICIIIVLQNFDEVLGVLFFYQVTKVTKQKCIVLVFMQSLHFVGRLLEIIFSAIKLEILILYVLWYVYFRLSVGVRPCKGSPFWCNQKSIN